MFRSLTMSAASGVSRASSPMRNTAPSPNPRTSSSVMTLFADSSRVTPLFGGSASGTVLMKRVGVLSGTAVLSNGGPAFSSTSRTNARIRSRVSSILVSQTKHTSGRADHFAGPEREIHSPNIDAALPDLEDQCLRAAWLRLLGGFVHEEVAMAAGDEVDAIDLGGEFYVVDVVARSVLERVAEVRHAHDERAALLFAQDL